MTKPRRKRSIVITLAHKKTAGFQEWYRSSDPLPTVEPTVAVSDVRLTKHKGNNGTVRISISGQPEAIAALSRHAQLPHFIRDAIDLAFTP